MQRKHFAVAVLIVTICTFAWAASSRPLNGHFLPNIATNGYGVTDDGNPDYNNGVQYITGLQVVRCYLGVNTKDANLVTYTTGRKLKFIFDPASPAVQNSKLPLTTLAEVDFYGVNFYGTYPSMSIGTTAQVQGSLQFKSGGNTFELFYQSLAAKRLTATTWLITSDHPNDIIWDPGFTASSQAELGVFRKRSKTAFGAVNMPIRFEVTLQ